MSARDRIIDRLKPLILILLAIFFAQKLVSGTLYYYIGPRFSWLAVVATALLILIAGAYSLTGRQATADQPDHNHDHDHDHEHDHDHTSHVHRPAPVWPLVIVALPLILGVLIPARPLGASAIESRGISTDVALSADTPDRSLTIIAGERNVLDWVRAMSSNPDPAALTGQQADVVGFVYRDIRFAEDQFMVARFTITCCVADALAIGVVVQDADAASYPTDSWVRVEGVFAEGALDGGPLPVLIAETITPVAQPELPYLYP